MTVHVLVDYDNVRAKPDVTPLDTALNLDRIFGDLVTVVTGLDLHPVELHVRLYSGWIDERGQLSPSAAWATTALPKHRGRRSGLRVLPGLALSALCYPGVTLRGTVRLETSRRRQKMVDGLIILDAVTLALQGADGVCIVSDDDDVVPAILGARRLGPIRSVLLRTVNRPSGLNDKALSSCGAVITSLMRYRVT